MVVESPFYLGKESPIFRDKSVFPYQGLFLREIWDLETSKFMNKYPSRISRLYLFIYNELAIYRKMADLVT